VADTAPPSDRLAARWAAVGTALGWEPRAAQRVLAELVARHREPVRRYHTELHVAAVLDHLDALVGPEGAGQRLALDLAAFFHDAVYDPRAGDNEERSAELAAARLGALGTSWDLIGSVCALVRATATHTPATVAGCAEFLDADLAILGSRPDRYRAYAGQIREEYAHVPDDRWRAGRREVLEGFQRRSQLFLSDPGMSRFERTARENIASELAQLQEA